MLRTIADFTQAWQAEGANTLTMMRALSDASLAQKVSPEGRSLGRLAWHLVQSLGQMGGHAGLSVDAANEKTPQPATADAIADAYQASAKAVEKAVTSTWTDADLAVVIDMYGQKWTRGTALLMLMAHEIHHRAQMTVLMRQAGLRVPGVYGPAREEWAAAGLPAED